MKRSINVRALAVLGMLVLSLLAMPAWAEQVFQADMTGEQEVVPSGSTAFGTATLIMNDALNQIAYTVNFAGLDAAQTAAGFFLGAAGEVGSQVMALPMGSPLAGIWEIDPEVAAALMDESLYINVFTDPGLFPDGEIRGNFTLTIVDNQTTSLDNIKALYR